MISRLILDEKISGEQPAVVTRQGSMCWSELRELARHFECSLRAIGKRRVGLCLTPDAESYAMAAALDSLACDVFLFDARLPHEEQIRLAKKLRLSALVSGKDPGSSADTQIDELPGEAEWSGASTVTILTSGSTGEPKAARHSWDSLSRPLRKNSANQAPRWLLTYRPNLYAGLQVMLQCFADGGTLLIPSVDGDVQSTAEFMCNQAVQFVSATPSYWRRLLMFSSAEVLRRVPLVQATLGGEVVDQPLLDRLKQCFPKARLVHIYATTELGRCFSVSDGRVGFPVKYLDAPLPDGVELRNHQGELMVRSPNAMQRYDPYSSQQIDSIEWFATGDRIAVTGDRVYFVGRKSDMINVAGNKVYPVDVERVIRTIPGVFDVRVFGKASSLAGELVACEIVPQADQDPQSLREVVTRICRSQLPTPQQPRVIRFVEQMELSAAGKTLRSRNS